MQLGKRIGANSYLAQSALLSSQIPPCISYTALGSLPSSVTKWKHNAHLKGDFEVGKKEIMSF